MIHLLKLHKPCEFCGRVVEFECIWFDTTSEDKEHSESPDGDNGEDRIGIKIGETIGFPKELVGKWLKCEIHRPAEEKNGPNCPMSYDIPKDQKILARLIEMIELGYGDPHPKPVDGQIGNKANSRGPDQLRKISKTGKRKHRKIDF